jgi:uncharacterized protein (TIGR02117 family)
MKKTFKYLFYLLLFPLFIVALYFLTAYIFMLFPTKTPQKMQQEKQVYILYSNIHSDIVFNINDINLSNFPEFRDKKKGYLAFGWGDKETYLNTPNIENIKLSTSFRALFLNTPSLMHVSYIRNILRYQDIKKIPLSKSQQSHLRSSIMQSFNFRGEHYKGYGREDFFYEAKGEYNLFHTCNSWTGDRLRESNVSMPYWTPMVWSVTNALP